MITFAIPMAPVSRCNYWSHAMNNLMVTTKSILKQTDNSYDVIIAKTKGDKIPDFCNRPKITIFSVEDSGEFSSDKDNKTLAMLRIHRELGNKYFLRTDWDDIYHKDLVKYVVEHENEYGFIIDKGYFYKPDSQEVIELDGFNMQCGSCHLVHYLENELINGVYHPKKFTFHHQHIHEYRQKLGRPLTPLPFRAGLYSITGKNVSTSKHERILTGKIWTKTSLKLKEDFNLNG